MNFDYEVTKRHTKKPSASPKNRQPRVKRLTGLRVLMKQGVILFCK